MRRRNFIAILGSAAAAWPGAARAQQTPPKPPTIGYLGSATPAAQGHWATAFAQRLRELGWIEGHTIAIEYRWAEGRAERAAEVAAEFVRRKIDVIVTSGTGIVLAAKQATSVIPIVFAAAGDPVEPASSRIWRDRAATSPAYRARRPILLASGLNSCARLSPASADWQS